MRRNRPLPALLTEASTAAYLGARAITAADQGHEDLAYLIARQSWKWATWAIESADALMAVTK